MTTTDTLSPSDRELLDAMLAPVGDDKMAKIASDNSATYYHDSALEGTDACEETFTQTAYNAAAIQIGVILAAFIIVALVLIRLGAFVDTQEAETEHNTARLKSLGLLPAEPLRFVERQDQPPTEIGRNFGAVDVAQEGAGR